MKAYLFDSTIAHENLLPLSFTRPLADIRCGILTIKEKWEKLIKAEFAFFPVEYLRPKYGTVENPDETSFFIAGNLLPDEELAEAMNRLKPGEALATCLSDKDKIGKSNDEILIFHGTLSQFLNREWTEISFNGNVEVLNFVFDIFLHNPEEIKKDYCLLTKGKISQPLPQCVRILQEDSAQDPKSLIFLEEGAKVECATINVSEGPVYIGKDAVLMEGACVRGPFALCEGSEVRMGAKIYEGTTIGPHCKVGGEISNVVFFGYSNKAHDGYLGNAVIGEWCNIGAGTNASNLKNDYSLIRVWNYRSKSFMKTNLQFCGLIMGDHSKIGVNCMINTATVIGVGVNLHGAGFPRTFIPCFCEGSPSTGFDTVPLKKFIDIADRVMTRREMKPSEADINLLKHIYENQ